MDLRTIVAMVFLAGFVLWFARQPKAQLKKLIHPLLPTTWLREVRRMDKGDWAGLGIAVLIFTSLMLVLVPLASDLTATAIQAPLIDPEAHPVNQVARVSPYLLMVLMVPVPIVEEWIFRGVLMRRLMCYGLLAAWLGSSLAFGLFHLLNPGTFVFAFVPPLVAGLVLGLAWYVGGLRVSALSHITYNEVMLLVALA